MASTIRKRTHRRAKPPRQEILQAKPVAPAVGPALSSEATRDPEVLPSRAALVARLEAQRSELLRAMSGVDFARRTIEQHRAIPTAGAPPVDPEEHEVFRQRVLEALSSAGGALATAYPMLERIVQALTVEEILKQHVPTTEPSPAESASAASKTGAS